MPGSFRPRLSRSRSTAPPTARVTVKPNLACSLVSAPVGLCCPSSTNARVEERLPFRTDWNSLRHLSVARRHRQFCALAPAIGHLSAASKFRRKDVYVPWPGAGQPRAARPLSAGACENRAGACARACSADRFVSPLNSVPKALLRRVGPAARAADRSDATRPAPAPSPAKVCGAYRVRSPASQCGRGLRRSRAKASLMLAYTHECLRWQASDLATAVRGCLLVVCASKTRKDERH